MSATDTTSSIDVGELAYELVSIPSPSGSEDAIAEYLIAWFADHGREAWVDDVGNVRAPADEVALLTTHLDTVSGHLQARLTQGDDASSAKWLYGRGSVDAKGALAAMATAAVTTGVSFAGVVREETDSAGAYHLINDRQQPEHVINGEPSGVTGIILGYRGIQQGTYAVSTPRVHPSRPDANAIDHLTNWWTAIADRFSAVASPFASVTVTPHSIDGGLDMAGTAVEASLAFELRVPPSVSIGRLRATLEGEDANGSIEWGQYIPPHRTDPNARPATALRWAIRDIGLEPRHLLKGGTSDANVYAEGWDCPVVTYGPGDASLDHRVDERIELGAIEHSVEVIEQAVAHLRGEPS